MFSLTDKFSPSKLYNFKMNKINEYFLGRFGEDAVDIVKNNTYEESYKQNSTIIVEPVFCNFDKNLELIECLCLTYGRFHLLREAVAFFLLQDYPNKSMTIVNDAAVPLNTHNLPANVKIINCKKRFETVGDKRQFALKKAKAKIVAHWDDDTYLPWHLYSCYQKINKKNKINLVKPQETLIRKDNQNYEITNGNWEASYVFLSENAIKYGGYSAKDVGQDTDLMKLFEIRDEVCFFPTFPFYQYILDRSKKYSRITETNTTEEYGKTSMDFGDFQFIIPSKNHLEWAKNLVSYRWLDYLEYMNKILNDKQKQELQKRFVTKIKG